MDCWLERHTHIRQIRLPSQSNTDVSEPVQIRTMDSTSHSIQWQVDTLGAQGLIRDVWVFDRNNAWAVGEIYLRDSTGKIDIAHAYNVAKWNGTRWQLSTSEDIGYLYGQLYCIFSFSPDDIWGGGTIPVHWDGTKWTFYGLTRGYPGGFYINKIFGTSSNSLFIVGTGGNIVYYNGSTWTKMASGTTVDLQDIYGIDANHIWATGTNTSDGHCVVLQYDGTNWTTIYDNANKPQDEVQAFSTVWGSETSKIFLAGQSWIRSMSLSDGSFKLLDNRSSWAALRIRGTKQNDIFQVGYGSEAMHFNGISWYHYPELVSLNGGGAWFYSVHPTDSFVVIGGLYLTALNGFPIVVRGYR
jgi:hypothetical protein